MPAPQKPKPPALCACGCGQELPAVRRSVKRYIDRAHWGAAHRERENARSARARKTPEGRIKARVAIRRWRKRNPEKWKAIAQKSARKRARVQAAYCREWRRRKAAAIIARPQPARTRGIRDAGLRVVRPGRRIGGRQDAEQDRVLAELERRARSAR